MASPTPQKGSKGWKSRERAKAELRTAIAKGIREEAREREAAEIREALRDVADMVEGRDFEAPPSERRLTSLIDVKDGLIESAERRIDDR